MGSYSIPYTTSLLIAFRDTMDIDEEQHEFLIHEKYLDDQGNFTEKAKAELANYFFKVMPTGLEIIEGSAFADWLKAGEIMISTRSALCWGLGDWCNFGEHEYGEKYDQVIQDTGYEYSTLRNYASICTAYPKLSRQPNISFSHHAVVAPLEMADRQRWLEIAVKEKLNRDDFRKRVFGEKPPKKSDSDDIDYDETGTRLFDYIGSPEHIVLTLQNRANLSPKKTYRIVVYEMKGNKPADFNDVSETTESKAIV